MHHDCAGDEFMSALLDSTKTAPDPLAAVQRAMEQHAALPASPQVAAPDAIRAPPRFLARGEEQLHVTLGGEWAVVAVGRREAARGGGGIMSPAARG
jgi:hypothetical protein